MHDDYWMLTTVARPTVCICLVFWCECRNTYGVLACAHRVHCVCCCVSCIFRFVHLFVRFDGWSVYVWVWVRATGGHFALLPTLRTSNDGISMWQNYAVSMWWFRLRLLFSCEPSVCHTQREITNWTVTNSILFIYVRNAYFCSCGFTQLTGAQTEFDRKQSRFTQQNWCDKNKMWLCRRESVFCSMHTKRENKQWDTFSLFENRKWNAKFHENMQNSIA